MSDEILLDAQIVIELQRVGQLELLSGRAVPLVVVEEVWDELTDHPSHLARGRQIREVLESRVRIEPIMPDTPEASTLAALHGDPSTTKNLGEAASIALASHREQLLFATVDRRAAFEAIRELRGRTIELYGLLRLLVADGRDRAAVVAAQTAIAARRSSDRNWSTPPVWWAPWLATLPP